MSSNPMPPASQTCSTPGCNRPLKARGFCVTCYYRLLRGGVLKSGSQTKKWLHRLSQVDTKTKTAICAACGPVRIGLRGNDRDPNSAAAWKCSSAANHRTKLYKRALRAVKRSVLLDHCEICGSKENLRWDHCHKTGNFRGTLCNSCNLGLGSFKDDPVRLVKAAEYIKKSS